MAFEGIITSLNKELDELRSKREKCEELLEKVRDPKKKAQLARHYDIIRHDIERVCLCISILAYQVSVEISADFTEVRFPEVIHTQEKMI